MPINVLVVDDSAVMRSMVIRSLRISGIPLGEVYQAGNGRDGLATLATHWVDLALVDINMPVMTGQEMIEKVRADPTTSDLPVLVVSTDCTDARQAMLRDHAVSFIQKPFTPEALRAQILEITGISDADCNAEPPISSGDFDF